MTLYLSSAGRFKGRFLALDLTTRTLSLMARLVGVTVALASVWASHAGWVDGMELCQRGVHAPIRLRTQHAGWYVGILANGLAFVSGAFAVLFGRGNVLGPTNNQLAMAAIDERQFDAITPAVGPYQVGLTPRGERVMRTPRPATFSEAHRANAGAFTRRDVDDEEIAMTAREYGVGGRTESGVWTGDAEAGGSGGEPPSGRGRSTGGGGDTAARDGSRRRGAPRGARVSAPPSGGGGARVAPPADGKRGWEEFKARFWRSQTSHSPVTQPRAPDGGSGRRSDPGDARYVAERNQRVGRLGNILGRFALPARVSRGGDRGDRGGDDASARSDRSDDSAEAARGAAPKKPPAFRPSVPPPRPTPVFQFSNPLASSNGGGAGVEHAHAPSAPPFEADDDRPGLDEPPADFEWNPLRDPYSITPSRKGAGRGRAGAGVGGRGLGGPSSGPAMSPPRPDAQPDARMERARAANEAARGDASGLESLRERMERLRREREGG